MLANLSNETESEFSISVDLHIAGIVTWLFVTEFAKTDLMGTNTETYFLSVDESHTHASSRDQVLENIWPGILAFFRGYKTTRVHFMASVAPEGH